MMPLGFMTRALFLGTVMLLQVCNSDIKNTSITKMNRPLRTKLRRNVIPEPIRPNKLVLEASCLAEGEEFAMFVPICMSKAPILAPF